MDITVRNLQSKIFIPHSKIKKTVFTACQTLRLCKSEISVCFVGTRRMRRFNKKYLGHDEATDVLTFDFGEMMICPKVAAANAKRFKTSTEYELILYVIHGLLHLAGYDDRKPGDIKRMRAKEKKLLERLL
ncbi:MAG: rRNA maturation RNase YbeY [Candidatus Omnitrophica bacterium]|nr:rRNA maturation RNase YbeY [Candidatus Omnitrophota bacterium]